jgi:CRISPR/Cas system-associated endonuclease Cas1
VLFSLYRNGTTSRDLIQRIHEKDVELEAQRRFTAEKIELLQQFHRGSVEQLIQQNESISSQLNLILGADMVKSCYR